MTNPALSLRRANPQVAVLLLVAAAAWLGSALRMRGMAGMPGTGGLGLAAFLPVWTLMMAAMMLPSVSPLASMYARSVRERRAARLAAFSAGYLLVWAAAGVPAFALASWAGRAVARHPTGATVTAVTIFAATGLYQLTPLKQRCLLHCRSPLAQLLRYGSWRGWSRDVRAGAHHGGYCLGCCWALMLLFVAFGVMNVLVMVALAAVVLVEKLWTHGQAFARTTGAVALVLAVAVVWVPSLAPGLHAGMGAAGM